MFFIVYQQIENHVIQPVVYGRTVQLSPLAVLIAVLIGAELAGVLGALGAIPGGGLDPGDLPRLAPPPPRRRAPPARPDARHTPFEGLSSSAVGRSMQAAWAESPCWLRRARRLCRRPLGRRIARRGDRRAPPRARCARSSRACSPTSTRCGASTDSPRCGFVQRLSAAARAALRRHGAARVLQSHVGERHIVRPADRPLLPDGREALLVGRREPALVVARRRARRLRSRCG